MVCDGEYTVRYVDLPPSIPGLTFFQDDHYNIYINSALPISQQEDALKHEIDHLILGDFDITKPIEFVEPYRCYNPKPLPFPIQPQEPVKKPAAPASRPDPDKIVTTGQLFAMAAKIRHNRETKKPWKLDKSKLDIWAE